MKKNFLALIVMLCGFAGIASAQIAKVPVTKNYAVNYLANLKEAQMPFLLGAVSVDLKKAADATAAQVVAPTPTCYRYTLTTNQGFSTTYQWTECDGTVRTQHLDVGQTTTVCAQDGTVSGGPYTKGAVCQ